MKQRKNILLDKVVIIVQAFVVPVAVVLIIGVQGNLIQAAKELKKQNDVLESAYNNIADSNESLKNRIIELEIKLSEVEKDLPQWITLPVYATGEFKSYMDGSMISDTTSQAYQQLQSLYVENGLYTDGKYIAIALASFYGHVGDKFRITLSSNQVFYAIMCDTKQDIHIDSTYAHKVDGSVIEFIVDTKTMNQRVLEEGSLNSIYRGSIVKIERLIQ